MSPSIRRAERTDAAPVVDMWLALLTEQAALDPRMSVAADAGVRWRNDFAHWVGDETRRIWVAEVDGRPVGFLSAHRWSPPPVYGPAEEVYIDELFVLPEVRNQGVGQALVATARAWAESLAVDRIRVGVLDANADGLRFWEAQEARPFASTLTIELRGGGGKQTEPARRLGF